MEKSIEVVFECHSLNNKNVRANELKILRKRTGEKAFEFGEDEKNIKVRYYNNEDLFEKDFKELQALKKSLENETKKEKVEEYFDEPIKRK